jgi:hypothetical protein
MMSGLPKTLSGLPRLNGRLTQKGVGFSVAPTMSPVN